MNRSLEEIAEQLLQAYTTKKAVDPPRNLVPGLDLAGAYKIQQYQEQALVAAGHRVIGRKIGLTSRAMQQQLGVDSPDFGFFTDQMVFTDGDAIDVSRFIAPKVEPELGFQLASSLRADADFKAVAEAIEGIYLAVEIIDSRVRDWDIRLVDTVADNASCGAVILGTEPVPINIDQLLSVSATMSIAGQVVGSGHAAAVMDHPLHPLVWLVHTLAEQGVALQKGDVILTGSFCGAAPVTSGETLAVDYGPFGTLTAHFQ